MDDEGAAAGLTGFWHPDRWRADSPAAEQIGGRPQPGGQPMPAQPANHADCPNYLRREMAALGVEITVSEARPLVAGAYPPHGYRCPHGTEYWIAPTGEQIAQWAANQTP